MRKHNTNLVGFVQVWLAGGVGSSEVAVEGGSGEIARLKGRK